MQYQYPEKEDWIRWHEETMIFDTYREAHTWAYDGDPYNEIGHWYDGYRCADPKIAAALVYELNRLQTFSERTIQIFAAEDYLSPTPYMVWVKPLEE